MNADVAELADSAVLRRLIIGRSPAVRGSVGVAFASGTDVATASIGDACEAARWPIGCLAKLLAATLVRRAAANGRLALDEAAAPWLGADCESLHGVTVRHLLEHTHGLDDSLLAGPRYEQGFIDRAELVLRLRALERFASPGAAYSYGHVGAWVAAAILERAHGRAFATLVREQLLEPLGVDGIGARDGAPLCAASGVGLELTAAQLVRFALRALTRKDSLAGAPITALPGWHPLERGVCMAWKYAGAGWFGHQSVWPKASSFLRVQPERGLALAVFASDEAAAPVALRVFGTRFQELFELQPRTPREATTTSVVPDAAGAYEQAARVIALAAAPGGWQAETWERDEQGVPRGVPARAALGAGRGVLFARPAREHLPYVELVAGENGARWLWNGRCVLRRAT